MDKDGEVLGFVGDVLGLDVCLGCRGLSLDFWGQPMMAHFEGLRSMCHHFAYLWILFICGWIFWILSVIIAKSHAYVIVVHVDGDVLKWYLEPS